MLPLYAEKDTDIDDSAENQSHTFILDIFCVTFIFVFSIRYFVSRLFSFLSIFNLAKVNVTIIHPTTNLAMRKRVNNHIKIKG